jgi:hypothetical protein
LIERAGEMIVTLEDRVRRLAFHFCLIALVLFAGAAPVHACKQPSDEWLIAEASTVFFAHLVRTEEVWGPTPMSDKPEALVEGTFRIVEVLKGQPPKDGKIRGLPWSFCSVPLMAATDYIFLLYGDSNFAFPNRGSGTIRPNGNDGIIAGATATKVERLRALVDKAK